MAMMTTNPPMSTVIGEKWAGLIRFNNRRTADSGDIYGIVGDDTGERLSGMDERIAVGNLRYEPADGRLRNDVNKSIGTGKMMVEFFSTEISVKVWR